MKAETAYNVFEALSPDEQQRMLSMIKVEAKPIKQTLTTTSDAQIREMILTKFRNHNKNRNHEKSN